MLLDAITSLVRQFGPFRAALLVTLTCVAISGLITAITMIVLGYSLFPALYLATLTPFGLALPVTYLTHLAVERADQTQQAILESAQDARAAQTMLRA